MIKKDVEKLKNEIKILENEKKENPGFSVEHGKSLAPYMSAVVPTLFSIVYRESEEDYINISNVMLESLDELNRGEIDADRATEKLGRYLFNKLVKPNI